MFRHSLVSNYILSVFAKLPVHPMKTLRHAREQVRLAALHLPPPRCLPHYIDSVCRAVGRVGTTGHQQAKECPSEVMHTDNVACSSRDQNPLKQHT